MVVVVVVGGVYRDRILQAVRCRVGPRQVSLGYGEGYMEDLFTDPDARRSSSRNWITTPQPTLHSLIEVQERVGLRWGGKAAMVAAA